MLIERGATVDAVESTTCRNFLHMSVAHYLYKLLSHFATRQQKGDVSAMYTTLATKDGQGFDALMLAIKVDMVHLLVQHVPITQYVACSLLIKSEYVKTLLRTSLIHQSGACSSSPTASLLHRTIAFRLATGSFIE